MLLGLGACGPSASDGLQGYVEGEYVRVAAAVSGRLQTLHAHRGVQLELNQELFVLEREPEQAALLAARSELQRVTALLDDLNKGKRPTEIAAIEAQLAQARAALTLSHVRLQRQQRLAKQQYAAREKLDELQSIHTHDQARIAELEADLQTAHLGARDDAIAAAEAAVAAAQARADQAQWIFDQKHMLAPAAGVVTDHFYRPGEWVPAGSPVVEILPPTNVKVRVFVPEPRLSTIRRGQIGQIACDACVMDLVGEVTYISPTAEYTPPVIYSLSTRAKLVYLVELRLPPERAVQLHPGQPVTVIFR